MPSSHCSLGPTSPSPHSSGGNVVASVSVSGSVSVDESVSVSVSDIVPCVSVSDTVPCVSVSDTVPCVSVAVTGSVSVTVDVGPGPVGASVSLTVPVSVSLLPVIDAIVVVGTGVVVAVGSLVASPVEVPVLDSACDALLVVSSLPHAATTRKRQDDKVNEEMPNVDRIPDPYSASARVATERTCAGAQKVGSE
jgi:hypothetical protein